MENQNRHLDPKSFIRHKLFEGKKSDLKKYAELVIGEMSFFKLLKYELLMCFIGPIPGALGLLLRKIFYRSLFKKAGRGIVIGRSVVIRHPEKISLGDRVVIDDYALIDARGAGDEGIVIGNDVIINRGVIIQAKVGGIAIGPETNVGACTSIISQGGVVIGAMVGVAGGCNISGGAFQIGRDLLSEREHEKYTKGPVILDKKCRLGMGVIVLDGVHIHEGGYVGAGSVVTHDLPEYSVAAGVPAVVKSVRERISK